MLAVVHAIAEGAGEPSAEALLAACGQGAAQGKATLAVGTRPAVHALCPVPSCCHSVLIPGLSDLLQLPVRLVAAVNVQLIVLVVHQRLFAVLTVHRCAACKARCIGMLSEG